MVAVAAGPAFTFRYAETAELQHAAASLEPVAFDPMIDRDLLPGACGLLLGIGFPEVHA